MPGKKFAEKQAATRKSEFEVGVEFVKFGEFSNRMLIWHSKLAGYFATDEHGCVLGTNNQRLPRTTVEMLAYASK